MPPFSHSFSNTTRFSLKLLILLRLSKKPFQFHNFHCSHPAFSGQRSVNYPENSIDLYETELPFATKFGKEPIFKTFKFIRRYQCKLIRNTLSFFNNLTFFSPVDKSIRAQTKRCGLIRNYP